MSRIYIYRKKRKGGAPPDTTPPRCPRSSVTTAPGTTGSPTALGTHRAQQQKLRVSEREGISFLLYLYRKIKLVWIFM